PGWFRCEPGAPCFHREWLCDGHPDCEDGRDESGCGTATPTPAGAAWETPPWRSAEPPPHVLTRCCQRFSACALSSLVLLSILVAVASIAERALSKAKNRSDIFSLENASREQLMPAKGQ
ncbi:RSVR protein, partial [Rhinopomastus cyanomelas]|nr:RSVR protein [Rhinopomastus cyanomelas]